MKYAAILTNTISVPGDERSRTNPGHGYPAHTVDALELVEFNTIEALEAWAAKQNAPNRTPSHIRYIQYEELEVTTTITVKAKAQTR